MDADKSNILRIHLTRQITFEDPLHDPIGW